MPLSDNSVAFVTCMFTYTKRNEPLSAEIPRNNNREYGNEKKTIQRNKTIRELRERGSSRAITYSVGGDRTFSVDRLQVGHGQRQRDSPRVPDREANRHEADLLPGDDDFLRLVLRQHQLVAGAPEHPLSVGRVEQVEVGPVEIVVDDAILRIRADVRRSRTRQGRSCISYNSIEIDTNHQFSSG